MDIAVLSDIHSNYIALGTCIDYILNKGITNFIFLGDYVSDCPYPQRSLQMLYELAVGYNCWFIRGNREDYMLDYKANGKRGWKAGSSSGCLLYTYDNLTSTDINFFQGIPFRTIIEFPDLPSLSCCHGSMNSSRELLYQHSESAKKALESLETDVLLCGHTHVQGTFEHVGKKIINPGAVGIPMHYDGKTQFTIIHGTELGWSEEFFQLEYDRELLLAEYDLSGLSNIAPMWIVLAKEAIKTGKDVSAEVVFRAKELCCEELGEGFWPNIPEKYWEAAVREQGICF